MERERVTEGGPGFFALPSSSVGRFAAGLLLASVVAIVLNNVLFMPFTESRTGLGAVQWVVNAAIGLCVLGSGATAIWAVLRQRERSWAVFLAIVLALAVLAFNIPWGPLG